MDLRQFYANKTVLLTGCTGFVGKVLLEKILWSFDVKKVQLLVRTKRKTTPIERMRSIFDSYLFGRIRRRFPDNESFENFITQKVELISGDLTVQKLGMSEEDIQLVAENTNIIINSAASVKFDDPIRVALEINYFGAQRMLELSKKCKNLDCLIHVSTAYVNSDRKGTVEEMIYQDKPDVVSFVNNLCAQSQDYLDANEKTILGKFPNTYTFTKNLSEKALQ